MDKVCSEINSVLNEMIVDGVKYEKIAGEYYDQMLFKDEELYSYLNDIYEVTKPEKTQDTRRKTLAASGEANLNDNN